MDKKDVITREIPERYLKIGGVQGITYLYLLSECCVPLEEENTLEKVIPFTELEKIPAFINELKCAARELFSAEPDIEGLLERSVKLREELKETATDVFAYQDILKLHEYVLRRTKPADAPEGKAFNDEAEARDILSAIFKAQTNAVINENISLCVAQLPLRMTKARYHDILMNELKMYADGQKSAFERNMFLMRMSAGIGGRPFDKLQAVEGFLNKLADTDLKNIDMNAKQQLEEELSCCSELLENYRDVLELIVQALDHLMVYMKNYRDSGSEAVREVLELKAIADEAVENLDRGRREKMSSSVYELFSKTEGVVDEEFEKITKSLGHFLKKSTQEEDKELKPYLERFLVCDRLLSQSYYADIDRIDEEEEETAGMQTVEDTVEEFCREMEECSAGESKMMSRARMAATFEHIPVFFSSRTEVMNYVLASITGCRDAYEKEVSLELAKKELVR
ncbi:MAG: hypothetical protein J5824_06830 [Lachnospiraceae bacterium]|nr:hypothetical protein [Lachnospiraceae bacterium]